MYDLPSEDPKEPGLPDEFHYYQLQLLRETFQPPQYAPEHFFVGTERRCCMTPFVQRIVLGLAVLICLGLSSSLPCAAETSKVGSTTKQVGRGVEDTAKGVGNTVVEGAKVAGEKIQEAGKTAQPQVEDTLNKVKDGAESAGTKVKNFFNKLFGK
jgi:gas vesicle protein